MDEKQVNANGDVAQPVDDSAGQPISSSEAPTPISEPAENTNTVVSETTEVITEQPKAPDSEPKEPVVVSEVTTVAVAESESPNRDASDSPAASKKKRTGLIAGIIIAILLLCGVGAFAAYAVIKNQPENIALESFSNLMSAKQVAVTGTFNITPGEDLEDYIGPISVNINASKSDANQSSNTKLTVNYPEFDDPINLEFGEVMMSDGVFYLKASGLQKIYEDIAADMIADYIESQLESQYQYSVYDTCYSYSDLDAYLACIDQVVDTSDPAVQATIKSQTAVIKSHIENIIESIDDEWFEFSIDDIMDSDLISDYTSSSTKESTTNIYDCVIDINQNFSNYTGELNDLYSKNQFVVLTPDQESYYKITFDTNKLASYTNGIQRTKLANDYASCYDVTLTDDMYTEVKADDFSKALEYLPDIYAKFDGFLNHHLTDLKISRDYDYFALSSNLSFTYPGNLVISAPAESTPIMEVVEDIMEELEEMADELES